jgi:RNA polymerase sigma-70 factor (ECF subfamily)
MQVADGPNDQEQQKEVALFTDAQLLERFSQPNTQHQAFNLLVRKYQRAVYGIIRKMVIDHDDANDLTQEVFLKVWHHLPEFRGEARFFTWLYRIASNEALYFLRKKKRRFFLPIHDLKKELSEALDQQLAASQTSPLSGEEIQMALQKALLQLPDKQRLVFNMRYYDELTYDDIAEITQTSVGALKASYHHAVKKIEKILNSLS